MNIAVLLQECHLELIHLGSTKAKLLRDLTEARSKLGDGGKKYVLCMTKPEGNYANGITVGKFYQVISEDEESYSVGDNVARVIQHPKIHFLSL